MEWWEDFQEDESEELLPVLHLSSDWSGSPKVLLIHVYAGHAQVHVLLRHPLMQCACACWDSLRPSSGAARMGERWAQSRASRMAALDPGSLAV